MRLQRTQNAKKGIFYGTLSNMYSLLMPFVMRTVLLYTLGVEYLGLNSLFASVLEVLNLAELGVGSAMVYSMYKPIADDDYPKICAMMRLYRHYYRLIGLVVCAAGLGLAPFLPKLIHADLPPDVNLYVLYFLYLGATVLSYWLFAYKNCLLGAYQRRDVYSKIGIGANSLKYILQILALLLTHNFYLYILAILFSQIANNIVTSLVVGRMFPGLRPCHKLPREEVKAINGRVRDLFIQKLGNVIGTNYGTLIVSSFLGLASLAMFQNYFYVLSLPIALFNVVLASCLAGIGNSLLTESPAKNLRDLRTLATMSGWISAVCCCGLLVLYQPFITMWVGEPLLFPMRVPLLFIVSFYLTLYGSVLSIYKDAAGIWHNDRFRPFCTAVAGVVISLLLVRPLGVCGVLIGSIMSTVCVSLPWLAYNVFTTIFRGGLRSFFHYTLKNALITLVACGLCFLCCASLPSGGLLWFAIKGLIALAVPNALLFLCYRTTDEYHFLLSITTGMLKLKR